MDEIRAINNLVYVVLGPTASGKTKLGVALAKALDGEIINADSRQVYRGMDIGTGKDLEEYEGVAHHLIDIRDPRERYDVSQFKGDFQAAYADIRNRGKQAITVGGTGLYLHSLFVPRPYIDVPVAPALREKLSPLNKEVLSQLAATYPIPSDFQIDFSSHKRLIRAIEILEALKQGFHLPPSTAPDYQPILIGISPPLEDRRKHISQRLAHRIDNGLIQEVEQLLAGGLSHEELQYFGLEYKYCSLYLLGFYSREIFYRKLETEIHRYAKRQLTFFRKMERDGLHIHWLRANHTSERLAEILDILERKKG